jgi:peptidoglycan/xylan/chitin deacetylase (PgdA/CDA1 family)
MQMTQTSFQWPHDNKIAVMVTVLLESWSEGKAPPYSPMTTPLKPGTYDRAGVTWASYGVRAGVWRIMRILNQHGIKGTICANARSIELIPDAMRMAVADGHEIAAHSYTQDALMAYMSRDEELAMIRRCSDVFVTHLGERPKGWISPVLASTDHTAELLAGEGFLWHGDYNDEDLPRVVATPQGSLVGLPHTDFADNRVLRQSPRAYFDAYKDTFDYLYANEPGSLINLTLHSQFGGRPLISSVFNEILAYLKGYEGVWFPRHDELAEWFKGTGRQAVPYAQRFFA